MILFFKGSDKIFYVVKTARELNQQDIDRLCWLFGNANFIKEKILSGNFIGPRKEMVTPWSTNAVEITQNMGIEGITRIEEFTEVENDHTSFDPMLQAFYKNITETIFDINKQPAPVIYIDDIRTYNKTEGLALNEDEIIYLDNLRKKISRKLTDGEVFGFSQFNSEHCRHKIFNGTFIIDGETKPSSLFGLIKDTSKKNPNKIVSAYKDNVAFIDGPTIEQFAPHTQDKPDFFEIKNIDSVISLKAETHNFPTTVEPFNGAATGSGGEIRDRLAGGKGSLPIAGTAVYMTAYPRIDKNKLWEQKIPSRKWLYQSPDDILIKASNGASDFGNKFGQPIICGSVLTFEHAENGKTFGYDKVIMLAGGIGFGKKSDSEKDKPEKGNKVIVMGGDNYRIGMGGGAVSSVATGEFTNSIELNAVQRSNPEMQKRVANAIRAMVEKDENPIVSIHDHGAGGHLNSLSELLEQTGGVIEISKLPIGDPTLSDKEIIGNESQERMGLVMKEKDIELLKNVSARERAPMYVVGEVTEDMNLVFKDKENISSIDLAIDDMFGNTPQTVLIDKTIDANYKNPEYSLSKINDYLESVLQLESVACKDWLTNKVDRSVTGKIAKQQTCGSIQLPLNNAGVVALDYQGIKGIATSIGHAPVAGLIDPAKGSILSVAESLTNIIWAPIEDGLKGISLSANWMWPSKNSGEDARLYSAVEAMSNFVIALGINIPTGKDSLSMTQKYTNGEVVYSPGTVIISAVGEVSDVQKVISPVVLDIPESSMIYIDFSNDEYKLGGSSFAQILNTVGSDVPSIIDIPNFINAFNCIQKLIIEDKILAGHDISAGGMIVTLLEMCFADNKTGLEIDLSGIAEQDIIKLLFSENPGIIIQTKDLEQVEQSLKLAELKYYIIGKPTKDRCIKITKNKSDYSFDINSLRDLWFKTSYLLDTKQSFNGKAAERFSNYKKQELTFKINSHFDGKLSSFTIDSKRRKPSSVRAAIIREKGVNGDREMAYSMYLAGFEVKDVHMTDLISGRENLEDVNFIVFVGGFSNSDVLGSAKGWAGAFLFNDTAKKVLDNFYKRNDTLSLGICNGCQLMVELNLIYPEQKQVPKMLHNDSHKFESSFLNVDILPNQSVMLGSLTGSKLGIWVAHGEGKFQLPYAENEYCIPVKYSFDEYPGNPNGSAYSTAGIVSKDGRHLAMMPHLERAIFPWQWAHYPQERKNDEITPWIEAFVNARDWIIRKKS